MRDLSAPRPDGGRQVTRRGLRPPGIGSRQPVARTPPPARKMTKRTCLPAGRSRRDRPIFGRQVKQLCGLRPDVPHPEASSGSGYPDLPRRQAGSIGIHRDGEISGLQGKREDLERFRPARPDLIEDLPLGRPLPRAARSGSPVQGLETRPPTSWRDRVPETRRRRPCDTRSLTHTTLGSPIQVSVAETPNPKDCPEWRFPQLNGSSVW